MTPHNIPEERRSHQHHGGSLKSKFYMLFARYNIKLCTFAIFVIVDFQAAFHT
jgi:hypothetical protein